MHRICKTLSLPSLMIVGALAAPEASAAQEVSGSRVTCSSEPGGRSSCPANTSAGIVLLRSTGTAPCLLGRTWGYEDNSVWVADGCRAEFLAGQIGGEGEIRQGAVAATAATAPAAAAAADDGAEYIPNAGFRLYTGEKGEIYMRLFSYARYLNQKGLEPTWSDYFGNERSLDRRQDIQLNKFFLPFSGWFLDPRFRYYLYVWSSNANQGDPAQVVGGGNISYNFNRFVTLGAGITSLPSVRSTEGQFPYWLGVDDRLTADEFFRGSYTSGVWLKGEIITELKYMVMVGNNLSTLGVSAARLNDSLDTVSASLQWLPTTGEFGLYGTFGDYDWHENLATRLGFHWTTSTEDRQSQPGTDSIENTQIRLTDGSNIFTDNLFAPGVSVQEVDYAMVSVDGGLKYRGMALEAEYYWRKLDNFKGTNVSGIGSISDHGYQIQASAMAIKDVLQVYAGLSEIRGSYGNAAEVRAGVNWFPAKQRGFRVNAEWLNLDDCPVGYSAVPYPVGGSGNVFHMNLELNF